MMELAFQKKLNAPSGEMNLQIELQIESGQLLTLYGKSGVGKTTTLNILAGLLAPDQGYIRVDGKAWLDTANKIDLPPQKRQLGYVFQEYGLFPNMSVRENLSFALLPGQDTRIVEELVELVELGELQNRKPATLSGGQRQRVALARALVQKPRLLLLDEPLSALDHEMRIKLQNYILAAHQAYGLTTILVSHDIPEIIKLSQRMVILDGGQIIRQGPPAQLLSSDPQSDAFQFVGQVVAIEQQENVAIVTILLGSELVKVIANKQEQQQLEVGNRVLVVSKTFHPTISKID